MISQVLSVGKEVFSLQERLPGPGSCCSGSVVTVFWGVSPSKCTLRGQTLLLCGHTDRGFEHGEVVFTTPSKVFTDT